MSVPGESGRNSTANTLSCTGDEGSTTKSCFDGGGKRHRLSFGFGVERGRGRRRKVEGSRIGVVDPRGKVLIHLLLRVIYILTATVFRAVVTGRCSRVLSNMAGEKFKRERWVTTTFRVRIWPRDVLEPSDQFPRIPG